MHDPVKFKINPSRLAATLLVACILSGCAPQKARPASGTNAPQAVRNNCCSLLSQLLHDEGDVSILRFIKRERPDLKSLIQKIAAESNSAAKLLQELARHDPSFKLDNFQLPTGETATRAAIAATERHELLGQTGEVFELTLLLTQAEALSYAWHLADVAAKNEPDPDRGKALAGLSQKMQDLHHEVFALLLAAPGSSATKKK